jgi:regulator of RNase E activity RraA
MQEILDLFDSQRSVALLADAAYRSGVPVGVAPAAIAPLDPARPLAGPVRTVMANNDLVSIIGAVHAAAAGDVMVIGNPDSEVGLIGDLIGLEAQRKELGGFVVDGCVRDRSELVRLGVPVFARGTVPVGPLKVPAERKGLGVREKPVQVGEASVAPGDWAFGDADGVIFVPGDQLDRIVVAAQQAQEREAGLEERMRAGEALGDVLQVEEFLRQREADPEGADFNAHLARIGRAI